MTRALVISSALLVTAGCFVPRDTAVNDQNACTRCHGDSRRDADSTAKAAPPFDVNGNTGTEYPGVGAHQRHLLASDSHGAIACTECHHVPATAMEEGHNVGKTTFAFGPIATGDGGITPGYDFDTRRCATACHGTQSGAWTDARSSLEACGSCHGLPPPAPHPQATQCSVCHADVVKVDGGFVAPLLHVDGKAEVSPATCSSCHGHDDGGAPPRALDGTTDHTSMGVGAHALHLSGGANTRPVDCTTCHEVPSQVVTPKHPNGGRAEVATAVKWNTTTATCTNNCHQLASPQWTDQPDGGLTCSSCHGAPPPAPHPQATNCSLCHANTTGTLGRTIVDRTKHVNGTVESFVPTTCDGCHGSSANFAPPRDTNGNTSTTFLGVGAHQAHVVGRGLARQVLCTECHVVPAQVLTSSHPNGVTEVVFSGVAKANLAQPSYAMGTCSNTACHDISNYTTAPGGGTATTPRWNLVDGSQSTCTSCHGMPPPPPHQARSDCETCHLNVTAQRTFVRPELHVNGHVDFF